MESVRCRFSTSSPSPTCSSSVLHRTWAVSPPTGPRCGMGDHRSYGFVARCLRLHSIHARWGSLRQIGPNRLSDSQEPDALRWYPGTSSKYPTTMLYSLSCHQVIVTGDFFQLPPVMKGGDPKFAFEAELWNATIKHTFNLTKVFRQTDQGQHTRVLSPCHYSPAKQSSSICSMRCASVACPRSPYNASDL